MLLRTQQRGFTVIELMVVTVILAITAGFAVPAFDNFFKTNRMRASEGEIATAIQFARAEAVRRGTSIHMSAVNATSNTNEWGPGLRVWLDADDDDTYDAGEELRVVGSFHNSMTVDGTNGVSTVIFRPTGLTNLASTLTFTVCDDR
ncbi:MAG: GspH/FimT family pseudopilin, partial [Oleiphilaceae bacterium]|nr:GspH/FimT family pseudopilin [Oleiphilaceae bacterium]